MRAGSGFFVRMAGSPERPIYRRSIRAHTRSLSIPSLTGPLKAPTRRATVSGNQSPGHTRILPRSFSRTDEVSRPSVAANLTERASLLPSPASADSGLAGAHRRAALAASRISKSSYVIEGERPATGQHPKMGARHLAKRGASRSTSMSFLRLQVGSSLAMPAL